MPEVWILDECSADDAARLRTFAADALRELGTDLGLPLHVPDEARADLRPGTLGWVSAAGAHIVAAALELDDRKLRHLVYHECGHWWTKHEYPELRGPFGDEVFAGWFAGSRSGCTAWTMTRERRS